ncbi:MAG TPA: ABC transporter permease subunit [Thermoanaerobaculia bacterium]|nr:ABC transporter permease subunit [Thermoanaerobaculia bacterium]
MKTLVANIEDVLREAAARWILITYFLLSTIFLFIFASAVNLDIINGTLAGARLFGKDVQMSGNEIPIEKLVLGFESGFSFVLYLLCTGLSIFATAHLVPRMQEKGTIDLYLARPVSRVKLLLSRYVAGLVLAGSNILYLVGTVWLIVIWKTHVVHPRFFLGGVLILFVIATLLAFAFVVGVVTSSTAVSIMTSFGLFIFSAMLVAHDRIAAAVSHDWEAWLINGLYWVVPKTAELGAAVVTFVSGNKVPERLADTLGPQTFWTTAVFTVACLALASWLFQRKEF